MHACIYLPAIKVGWEDTEVEAGMIPSRGSRRGNGGKAQYDQSRERKLHNEWNNGNDGSDNDNDDGFCGLYFVQVGEGWMVYV